MIKRITLLVAVVALSTAVSFGQMTFGIKAGANLSNVTMSGGGISLSNKMLVGFEVGGLANFKINDKMAFQPEVMFAQYGCNFDKLISDKPLKENVISIPLMVKYSLGSINILAGPQLGYILSAKVDGEDAMATDAFDMKKLDYGVAVGLGYEMENGIGIDARYYLGMANLTNTTDMKMKNNSIQIAVSYKFK